MAETAPKEAWFDNIDQFVPWLRPYPAAWQAGNFVMITLGVHLRPQARLRATTQL